MELSSKVIIYDDTCPLCNWYTGQFIKTGMLSDQGRKSFTELSADPNLAAYLDQERSRHEIPLVDKNGGEVIYGLDSLLHILQTKIPALVAIARWRPLYAFFKRFYGFISYNRRIVVPSKTMIQEPTFDCSPRFHASYRLAFILFCIGMAMLITALFGVSLGPHFPSYSNLQMSLIALLGCGSGWILQMLLATSLPRQKNWDYWGQLAVIMLIGVLVLVPSILAAPFLPDNSLKIILPAGSVLLSASLMLREHRRRMSVMGYSPYWTLSWLLSLAGTSIATLIYFFA